MTKRTSKQKQHRERELTAGQVQDLIDMAQKTSTSMLAADEINQAYMLLAVFNAADRVYGLWPDSSQPSGYAYSIMKGEPAAPPCAGSQGARTCSSALCSSRTICTST